MTKELSKDRCAAQHFGTSVANLARLTYPTTDLHISGVVLRAGVHP